MTATPTDRRPPVADQLELMRRLIDERTLTAAEARRELGLEPPPPTEAFSRAPAVGPAYPFVTATRAAS